LPNINNRVHFMWLFFYPYYTNELTVWISIYTLQSTFIFFTPLQWMNFLKPYILWISLYM
jgi:hypothetical protein